MKSYVALLSLIGFLLVLGGCISSGERILRVPAVEYADRVRKANAPGRQAGSVQGPVGLDASLHTISDKDRASLHLVSQDPSADPTLGDVAPAGKDIVTNLNPADGGYTVQPSTMPQSRDYNGPLSLGDPGISASLWKESRAGNMLFRDYRAWQPLDLITIVITERAEGNRKAETDIKLDSSVQAGITHLFGWENTDKENKKWLDLKNMITANAAHDVSGEGETKRKGSLKATISAMVVEVLPSGILRIEGEKILAVNNDDEVMIISGLVRPEDVNSNNEVDSGKVANMRIDYTGTGSVSDAQTGGWLGNLVRRYWPF